MTSPKDALPTVLKTKAAGKNNKWGGKAAPLILCLFDSLVLK
jgi:hypothetical protein